MLTLSIDEGTFSKCMYIDSPFKEIQNTPDDQDEDYIETIKDSRYFPSKGIYEFKKKLFPDNYKEQANSVVPEEEETSSDDEDTPISFLDKVIFKTMKYISFQILVSN